MKRLLLILDGMTDQPGDLLPVGSPLFSEEFPVLRALCSCGGVGELATIPPGHPADTLHGVATLLGVPAPDIPQGRAALEALAAGLEVGEGDAVLRCNLIQLDGEGHLVSASAQGLSPKEKEALWRTLAAEAQRVGLLLRPMGDYRGLLLCPGEGAALAEAHCQPPHQNLGRLWNKDAAELCNLSLKIQYFTEEIKPILKPFPNIHFSLWEPSRPTTLPSFQSLHKTGAAVVTATPVVAGLARAMGLNCFAPPAATADVDTDLAAKLALTQTLLGEHPLVVLHINGADEAAHRRNLSEKLAFLHRVEEELLAPLVRWMEEGDGLLLCSDHSTLSTTGEHLGVPQPFVLHQKGQPARGNLGRREGREAVELLLGLSEPHP